MPSTRSPSARATRPTARPASSPRGTKRSSATPRQNIFGPPRYSTNELDLLLWVVATLVWSAVGGYERAVGVLSVEDKHRFYADMRTLGTFFDLPRDYGPQTYADFERYLAATIADPA